MKKKKLIPFWLILIDLIYVACYLVSAFIDNLPGIFNAVLSVIMMIPRFIADNFLWPVIILNVAIIILRLLNRKKARTNPVIINTPSAPVITPQKVDTAGSSNEGHMDLF